MLRLLLFISFLGMTMAGWAGPENDDDEASSSSGSEQHAFLDLFLEYMDVRYQQVSSDEILYVAVRQQKLFHIADSQVVRAYDISTAAEGVGNQWGSNKTPPGLHMIRERIGEGVPEGGVFKARRYTGDTAEVLKEPAHSREDLVTSRILWLDGLEEGVNKGGDQDSYRRYIYIHGTPEEGLIGRPVSHGCVRMRNADVIDLFQKVSEGTPVVILDN